MENFTQLRTLETYVRIETSEWLQYAYWGVLLQGFGEILNFYLMRINLALTQLQNLNFLFKFV